MKRVLLTFVAVLSAWVSMAQVTIKHDTVWYKGFPKDNAMHSLKDTIVNNTASTVTVSWSKSADQILTGWSVLGLCDPAACYLNSNDPHSVTLGPGESGVWYVDMKAATTAQDGTSWVKLTTNYGDMVFMFQTWPTNTNDFDASNLVSIYPNPASDRITINLTDKRINTIHVLSVTGRKLTSLSVDPSRDAALVYALDHVANGVYLLQFADNRGKILGVRRVTKN